MAFMSQEHKKELAPSIKAVLKKYNMKGSISVQNHSSIVVTLQSGEIDFNGITDQSVNVFWIDDHWEDNEVAKNFLNELYEVMKGPRYFDESDIQSDYFHTSHYVDINIGKWNKPYVCTAEEKEPQVV